MAGFLKKIWKPRIVEYPGRRRLDDTSQPEVYDVSRAEGNIIQQGDGFTADNMNDLEERIASSFDELNENITWKYLGHDGLRRRINLPENFTELQITAVSDVLKEVNEQCRYSINILYAQLSDEIEMEFRAGHFYRPYAENSASIGITATRKYIFVNWSSESSNDTSNSAYIYVWYR